MEVTGLLQSEVMPDSGDTPPSNSLSCDQAEDLLTSVESTLSVDPELQPSTLQAQFTEGGVRLGNSIYMVVNDQNSDGFIVQETPAQDVYMSDPSSAMPHTQALVSDQLSDPTQDVVEPSATGEVEPQATESNVDIVNKSDMLESVTGVGSEIQCTIMTETVSTKDQNTVEKTMASTSVAQGASESSPKEIDLCEDEPQNDVEKQAIDKPTIQISESGLVQAGLVTKSEQIIRGIKRKVEHILANTDEPGELEPGEIVRSGPKFAKSPLVNLPGLTAHQAVRGIKTESVSDNEMRISLIIVPDKNGKTAATSGVRQATEGSSNPMTVPKSFNKYPCHNLRSRSVKEALITHVVDPIVHQHNLKTASFRVTWRVEEEAVERAWQNVIDYRQRCDTTIGGVPAVCFFVSAITGIFSKPTRKGTVPKSIYPGISYWIVSNGEELDRREILECLEIASEGAEVKRIEGRFSGMHLTPKEEKCAGLFITVKDYPRYGYVWNRLMEMSVPVGTEQTITKIVMKEKTEVPSAQQALIQAIPHLHLSGLPVALEIARE